MIWWSVVIRGHWRQANLSSQTLNVMEKRIILASGSQDSLDQRGLPQNPVEDPGDLITGCWTCRSSSLQRCCRRCAQTPHFPQQCPSLSLNYPPGTECQRYPGLHRGHSVVCSPGSLQGEEGVTFERAAAARGNPPSATLVLSLHIHKRAFFVNSINLWFRSNCSRVYWFNW